MFYGIERSWYAPDETERERQHQIAMQERETYIRQALDEWDDYQQVEVERQLDVLTELEQIGQLGEFTK